MNIKGVLFNLFIDFNHVFFIWIKANTFQCFITFLKRGKLITRKWFWSLKKRFHIIFFTKCGLNLWAILNFYSIWSMFYQLEIQLINSQYFYLLNYDFILALFIIAQTLCKIRTVHQCFNDFTKYIFLIFFLLRNISYWRRYNCAYIFRAFSGILSVCLLFD